MRFWVDDVEAVYLHFLAQGLDVIWPPTDEPWGVREMHVRHPDGHAALLVPDDGALDQVDTSSAMFVAWSPMAAAPPGEARPPLPP